MPSAESSFCPSFGSVVCQCGFGLQFGSWAAVWFLHSDRCFMGTGGQCGGLATSESHACSTARLVYQRNRSLSVVAPVVNTYLHYHGDCFVGFLSAYNRLPGLGRGAQRSMSCLPGNRMSASLRHYVPGS